MVTELLGNAALWPAEQIVNQVIDSDKHFHSLIAQFEGKALQVQVTLPPFPIRLSFNECRIRLSAIDSEQFDLGFDAKVTASASAFSQFMLTDSAKRSLVSDDLKIEGDTQFVQDLFIAMNQMDIQWEDLFSPLLGDIGTHQLSQIFDNASSWLSEGRSRMQQNVDDYLKEEARIFPSTIELGNFKDSLDELRLRIDRTEARIGQLRASLEQKTST